MTAKTTSIDAPFASLDDYLSEGGGGGLTKALASEPASIIDEVKRAGLRGRGGAGFPTGTKWEAVAAAGPGVHHVVCNGAEGEPGTFKDRWLMRRDPYQVIEGLAIAAFAVGAQEGHIGLKRSFRPEREAIERAIREMTDAGLLGAFAIAIHDGPDEYLFGEEKALLEVIEGNLPMPRILPPYQEGLFASAGAPNPTVVNNVETLSNVPRIIRDGAREFRRRGTESSPGTMLFTICGDVRVAGIYELPLGTPLRVLVEEIAGGPPGDSTIKAIFPGASAGVLTENHLGVPLEFDALKEVGSGLGSAGFVVYDSSACIVRALRDFSRFLWIESCAQCPACKHGTGDITAALDRIESGTGSEADLNTALGRTQTVTDGQRCALPTGARALVGTCFEYFDEEIRAHLDAKCPAGRDMAFPKIVDYDQTLGRFTFDDRYRHKRPDWTYEDA